MDTDSNAPAQPSQNDAYTTAQNPAEQTPSERQTAAQNAALSAFSSDGDVRIPTKQTTSIEEGTFSSLGRGIHGAPPGEERLGARDEGQEAGARDVDAVEQIAPPAEGEVFDAVANKSMGGMSGGQPGLESDLERKKREQAPLREGLDDGTQHGKHDVDVQGVLEQR